MPAALLQPISGDLSAKAVARVQPAKLAAMEAHFETRTRAPLLIGGWPDMERGDVDYAIRIPGALSFLAFGDPDAEVKGLEEFPRDEWPHVPIVHVAFQIMVGLGTYLALLSLCGSARPPGGADDIAGRTGDCSPRSRSPRPWASSRSRRGGR